MALELAVTARCVLSRPMLCVHPRCGQCMLPCQLADARASVLLCACVAGAFVQPSQKKVPAKIRNQQFEQNINKRGKIKVVEKEEKTSLGTHNNTQHAHTHVMMQWTPMEADTPSCLPVCAVLLAGPVVIGFFLFVVVGSALFQIIRTAQSGRSF